MGLLVNMVELNMLTSSRVSRMVSIVWAGNNLVVMRLENAYFETSTSTGQYLPMVRSSTIARASDALPLAASVDDEQVSQRSQTQHIMG